MLNPAVIIMALILPLWICLSFLWPLSIQASFVGMMKGPESDSAMGLGLEEPGIAVEDRFHIVDQLESVGIDDRSFFDFSGEGEAGPGSSAFDVEVYTGGFRAPRTSLFGFDRGIAFDRGTRFDEGRRFDRGEEAKFDRPSKVDKGAGFDSIGGFDRERTLRIGGEEERPASLFQQEQRFDIQKEKESGSLSRQEGGGRIESGLMKRETGEDALSREKEQLEDDLLRSEELELRSFRPTQTGFFIKIGMFAAALLLLLAGTLKGLIPLRFYFFLTILILILWNPMESLFISIIIGLSALLAPILG